MKNKILALALSLTFLISGTNVANASEMETKTENESSMTTSNAEMRQYLFNVSKIEGNNVILSYAGEMSKDALSMETSDQQTTLTVDKSLFDKDIAIKDKIKIETNKILKDLKAKDIKKENISLVEKYQKPENMDIDNLPKDATSMEFVVKEINDDPVSPSAILYEASNEKNLYTLGLDQLRDEDVKVGNKYKIYSDGITLESYPAQFGKIYRVEKISMDETSEENTEKTKLEFEVIEKSESGATLAEVGNKDNQYNISFEDLKDKNPEIGDRYMITWSGMSTKSYPAQFIDVMEVEKAMKKDKNESINKDELKKAIEKADKTSVVNASYSKESIKAFKDAKKIAKDIFDKENPSQEEIDKATKELLAAIDGLTFVIDRNMEETKIYEIIEIKGEGEDKKVILKEKDGADSQYQMSYKMLNDKDAKVGDAYEIKTDGVILPSNPAQFGKVLEVKKIENDKSSNDKSDKKENSKRSDKKEDMNKDGSKGEEKQVEASKKDQKQSKFGKAMNPKTGIPSVAPLVGVIAGASLLLKKKFK